MENASKALIIAGAILLSILIIAIGMYIYNSSQNSINEAGSQISAQEVQSFNQTWEMYEGTQSGANVRSLISKMASNAKANETEATRLPGLDCEYSKGKHANVAGNNFTDQTINGFNTARTNIEARHNYTVSLELDAKTALVNKVIIKY